MVERKGRSPRTAEQKRKKRQRKVTGVNRTKVQCQQQVDRLERTVQKLREQFYISEQLSLKAGDLHALAVAIANQLRSLVSTEGSSVMFLCDDGHLRIEAAEGLDPEDFSLRIPVGRGVAGTAFASKKAIRANNTARSRIFLTLPEQHTPISAVISAPLLVGSDAVGVVNVHNRTVGRSYPKADREILKRYAIIAAPFCHNAILQADIQRQATFEETTGLLRKRVFFRKAHERCAAPGGYAWCHLLVLDIDRFKTINDAFGHPSGDAALLFVAAELQSYFANRPELLVSRIGHGDEFAIFVPSHVEAEGRELRDILKSHWDARSEGFGRAISEHARDDAPKNAPKLSVSVGVVTTEISKAEDIQRLFSMADREMYKDKLQKEGTIGEEKSEANE